MALLGIRTTAEQLVNNATVAVWGQGAIVYTDTNGDSDTIEAVFDEAYQLTDTGDGGERLTMTAPVLSCRLADFVNSTPEGEGKVQIGARRFVVNGVEKTGHQDCRLILTERTV